MTDNVAWWYISKGLPQDADTVVIRDDNVYYGYIKQPSYEIIEQYDLRRLGVASVYQILSKIQKV